MSNPRSSSAVTEDNPKRRTLSVEFRYSSARSSISAEATNSLHSPGTRDDMRFPSLSKISDSDSEESPYEIIRDTNRKGLLNIPKGEMIAKKRFHHLMYCLIKNKVYKIQTYF